jgi:di/tricarboxylate transporter
VETAQYIEWVNGQAPIGGLMPMRGDQWKGVPPHWTARSGGIIYPIISDLAPIYGSKPNDVSARRIESYLMWVAIATTCVTSSLFLTAASFNLLAVGLVEKLTQTDLRWTDWFSTAAPTIIPLLILIPLLTYRLYPPEVKHSPLRCQSGRRRGSKSWGASRADWYDFRSNLP